MQNVTLSHLKLFHVVISGKLQQYVVLHESTWQHYLWDLAAATLSQADGSDKNSSGNRLIKIYPSLHCHCTTTLSSKIPWKYMAVLLSIRKTLLIWEKLCLIINSVHILIRIIHLLFRGTEKAIWKDTQNLLSLMCSRFCSCRRGDNHFL